VKITEIINEEARHKGVIDAEQESTMSNTHTYPDQNMYHGSGYKHSQFVRALAGAGAGDTPSENMGDENWAAGDPIITPYHPVEEEMMDNAARHIGDNSKKTWGNRRSQEPDTVHKTSPVQPRGPVTLKSSAKK
jgi:hypothetical protein